MSRRRRRRARRAFFRPRRGGGRGGGGGSRWGVDLGDVALGGVAEVAGAAVQNALGRFQQLPDFIRSAPAVALGLYALGVAFSRRSIRSVGAGMAVGRLVGVFGAGPVGP